MGSTTIYFYTQVIVCRGGGTHSNFSETPMITTYFQGGYYLWELEYQGP